MVISYSPKDEVVVKTKNTNFTLGEGVTIGTFAVPGAGEYDVAGIYCEAKGLAESVLYMLRCEDVTLTYLSKADESVLKEDEASNTAVLVVYLHSDVEALHLKPILKALEPLYLFLIGPGATPALQEGLGLPKYEGNVLKVTATGLPIEGPTLVSK